MPTDAGIEFGSLFFGQRLCVGLETSHTASSSSTFSAVERPSSWLPKSLIGSDSSINRSLEK